MISQETLKKIKQIEIHTRRLLNGSRVGDTRSKTRGSGFEFDQIREYQTGDDVRFIDWKSSARMNKLLVKQYIEERSRCVMIALDGSASGMFTSAAQTKYNLMSEVAAVLALVAEYGNDSSSLVLFADAVQQFIPPNKGRNHVHTLMQHIFEHKMIANSGAAKFRTPDKIQVDSTRGESFDRIRTGGAPSETKLSLGKTTFRLPLEHIARLRRKDALVVLISDFIDIQAEQGIEKFLGALTYHCEVVAIRCLDVFEDALPNVGFLTVEDIESGGRALIDTRGYSRERLQAFLRDRKTTQENFLKKYGIDFIDITPGKPFMNDIVCFFRRRMTY